MIFGLTYIELIGYFASVVIATSMMMNSILRLRWINLIGAATFSTYGFIIGALPVGILNAFIAVIDIVYLYKIYSKKELFKILQVRSDNKYLLQFLKYYVDDIHKIFPEFIYKPELNKVSFFILRNMAVAGLFLAREYDKDTLYVGLDYAIPQYRDFKLGRYVYNEISKYFVNQGYKKICAIAPTKKHATYLKKMGFHEEIIEGRKLYFKEIHKKK